MKRQPDSKIMERLAKLIRHQESAHAIGSIAEAEAFGAKIQELLTAHKLEMSEVEFTERETAEPVDSELVCATEAGARREARRVEWMDDLARSIARNNGCQILITRHSNAVFFVGRTSDREAAAHLYKYFVGLATELALKASKDNLEEERHKAAARHANYWRSMMAQWMKDYRRSFCRGFSSKVSQRMSEQRREMEAAEVEARGEQSTAMVHIKKDEEAIDAWMEDHFKDRKPSKAQIRTDEDSGWNQSGYESGKRAGGSVALSRGTLDGASDRKALK